MIKKVHHIKSKVFEVSFFNAPEGLEFQKAFSDFIKDRISNITEKCLDEFDSPHLKVINRLELDLGNIPYDRYQQSFEQRYEEQLMKELTNKLVYEGADHVEEVDAIETLLDIIGHFLVRGYMPWNFDNNAWHSFSHLFDHTLDKDQAALLQELGELLKLNNHRVRLINQLEEDSIIKLVKAVVPSQSEFIIEYHRHWMKTQKKQEIFNDQAHSLSKSFWLFIFNYLYEDRGSFFNTKSFLIHTLHQIANHFNLSYDEVLSHLRSSYHELKADLSSEFSKVIKLITEEEIKEPEDEIAKEKSQISVEEMIYLAMNGKWKNGKIDSTYPEILNHLLRLQTLEVRKAFKSLSTDFKSMSRLIEPLDTPQYVSLIQKLDLGNSRDIENYHSLIVEANRESKITSLPDMKFAKITWVLIFMTLLSEFHSYYNHKSFVRSLLLRISNHHNLPYKQLLVFIKQGLEHVEDHSRTLESFKWLLDIIALELNEGKDLFVDLQIESLDHSLLEESVISGVIHPHFRKYGFSGLKDILAFFNEKDPRLFEEFVKNGLRKSRFRKQLITHNELLGILFRQSKFHSLRSVFSLISSSGFPSKFHLSGYRKAITSLMLSIAFEEVDSQSYPEKELIRISNEFGIDFNEFIKSLIWIDDKITNPHFHEMVTKVAGKMGVTDSEAMNRDSDIVQAEEDLGKLVRLGIRGIIDPEKLVKLGFKSLDEVIRYLIRNDRDQLRVAFGKLDPFDQPYMGIGRDIPLATYYSLILALDETYGRQLAHLLRTMEVKLGSQSQSINRFLSLARSLAIYHLSQTFHINDFLNEFSRLILDTSPDVYTQVIPVLSANISTISIPARGNTHDFINKLEHELSNPDMVAPGMDAFSLSKAIHSEFFDGVADRESTIIPYFEESTDAVFDEIYIENAGLVLLSSYIPSLFEKFSLMEDGAFLSLEKQETAVLLLQHLMMVEPPLNEHHLPLNKILCGLEVNTPIRSDFRLGSRDKKTVDGLIEAVIGYWSAIGHSSIEGFQGSWLWRKGKLEHKEELWELKVEQHAYDMLLDRFPFTISPVKFSWMNKPLIVEWR